MGNARPEEHAVAFEQALSEDAGNQYGMTELLRRHSTPGKTDFQGKLAWGTGFSMRRAVNVTTKVLPIPSLLSMVRVA